MKLLLVEDHRTTAELLVDALRSFDWTVDWATDGEVGLAMAETQAYDLILLDIGLPKLDGITLCRKIRSQSNRTPILLLTGKDSTNDQIAGLDAGADDYVTKPFDLKILLARIRALARREKPDSEVMNWENVQLDSTHSEVTCNGQALRLTPKEYCLLELFLLNPKQIFSRRAILDRLWDFADSPGEETVSTHIKCLRQKLKAAGANDPIETVHGLGYRLRAPQGVPAAPPLADSQSSHPADIHSSPSPQVQPAAASAPALAVNRVDPATAQKKAQAVTSRVWDKFKALYIEQVNELEQKVKALQPGVLTIEQRQEIEPLAHKLAGSLGIFGLMEASRLTRQLEQLIQATALQQAQVQVALELVSSVQQLVQQACAVPASAPEPDSLVPDSRLPDSISTAASKSPSPLSSGPLILIVDDDLLLAERLRIEAIAWNLRVEIATDLQVARKMIARTPPQVVLLDLNFPGEDGLTLMQELRQRSPQIAVVVLTGRESLLDRVAVARLGVSAFLHKPMSAQQILKAVTDGLNPGQHAGKNRALLVDDDPGFLAALTALLLPYGIQITTSTHPPEFWQVLTSCSPDLLILDLQMPGFDGIELCQVVRADPQWRMLKILFLSAHTDPELIARAYAAGADDYINKATPEPELIERILYRLQNSEKNSE